MLITDHNVRETSASATGPTSSPRARCWRRRTGHLLENPDVRRVYLGEGFTL